MDYYTAKYRDGLWKPDSMCEARYCHGNRTSERFCDYHRRLNARQ